MCCASIRSGYCSCKKGEIRYLARWIGLDKAVDYHRSEIAGGDGDRRAARSPPAPQCVCPEKSRRASRQPSLVRFEDVAFGYDGENDVLHGINLDIRRGDVIAVLGPNGAGKTTLVKHAIGLLKPKARAGAGERERHV